MWVLYKPTVAASVNIIMFISLVAFIVNGCDVISRLYLSDQEVVSGQFRDFGRYQQMNDLDSMPSNRAAAGNYELS